MEDTTILNNMAAVNSDDYLFQKKIEIMIDTNNKKITRELNDIKEIIAKLNEDFCELRKHFNENQTARAESPLSVTPAATAVASPVAISSNANLDVDDLRKNGQLARPRYGDYKSEDVSINKIFYFGSKK